MRQAGAVTFSLLVTFLVGCTRPKAPDSMHLGIVVVSKSANPFRWTFLETTTVMGNPVKKRIETVCEDHEWPLANRTMSGPDACQLEDGWGQRTYITRRGASGKPSHKQIFDVVSAELIQ